MELVVAEVAEVAAEKEGELVVVEALKAVLELFSS